MRPLTAVLIGLVLLDLALLWISPSDVTSDRTGSPRVGLVFDVGGVGDKSFNDSAYQGLMLARKELGAGIEFIEPGDGADRESGLRLLAAQGCDLVLGIGFMFTDDLNLVAREYPGVRFGGVDYAIQIDASGNPVPPPHNLLALKFREEEGSFLVGALAGLMSKTGTVGFVGGMDIPLIHKFEAGYKAGAKNVCPECTVLIAYAGVSPQAFKDPGKGKELALAQYSQGADIIFHASGSTGLGVFEAARERNKLAIGVDSDQYAEAPGYVLTSMVKRVDQAVLRAARDVQNGTFQGGIVALGLKEEGVDYVYDDNNRANIPSEVRARVEALRADIIAGRIDVPSE